MYEFTLIFNFYLNKSAFCIDSVLEMFVVLKCMNLSQRMLIFLC